MIFTFVISNSRYSLFPTSPFTALRIHISQPTTSLLLEIGGFELHERGNIEIKVNTGLSFHAIHLYFALYVFLFL